jgi:hypothetical protein
MRHAIYAQTENIAYPIFFTLTKASKLDGIDGLLNVISAYRNPQMRARSQLQSIKFARLVHQNCKPKPLSRIAPPVRERLPCARNLLRPHFAEPFRAAHPKARFR